MKKVNKVEVTPAPVEKETRPYIKHSYDSGLSPEQKRKQRRETRKKIKALLTQ